MILQGVFCSASRHTWLPRTPEALLLRLITPGEDSDARRVNIWAVFRRTGCDLALRATAAGNGIVLRVEGAPHTSEFAAHAPFSGVIPRHLSMGRPAPSPCVWCGANNEDICSAVRSCEALRGPDIQFQKYQFLRDFSVISVELF